MDVFKTLIHSQPGAVGSNVAITGGSVNGTNIGATTPGTGAFTTISATGTISSNLVSAGMSTGSNSTSGYSNYSSDIHGGTLLSSNVKRETNDYKIANTHASLSGMMITTPGASQTNQGEWQFWAAAPASVTAGNAYAGTKVFSVSNTATSVLQTTASTNTTTGALVVSGGIGVAGAGYFGGNVVASHSSSAILLATTSAADSTAYIAFTPQSGTGKSFSVGAGGPGSTVDGGALANKFFVRNNSTGGYSMLIDGTSNATTLAGSLIIPTSTPASAAASGTAGTIAWDSSYIYVCTGTNQWKRVAIATW